MDGVRWMSNYEALCFCPFHENTRTPAMMINYRKGVFLCNACGERGTLFAMAEKLGAPLIPTVELDDVAASAALLRLKMENDSLAEPMGRKSDDWLRQFTRKRHPYWWENRRIPTRVQKAWGLGYDGRNNAVTIPLRSLNGSLMGVIRRSLDEDPIRRYRYPVGFQCKLHLFGAERISKYNTDIAIVEGSIDAIRVEMVEMPCVAVLGDYFSDHQIELLRKVASTVERVHVFMDNDSPGRKAQLDIENRLQDDGFNVFRPAYPRRKEGKQDPGGMSLGQLRQAFQDSRSIRSLRTRRLRGLL